MSVVFTCWALSIWVKNLCWLVTVSLNASLLCFLIWVRQWLASLTSSCDGNYLWEGPLLCFSIAIIYFAFPITFIRACVCLASLTFSVYEENLCGIVASVANTFPQCLIRMGVVMTDLTSSINMKDFIEVIAVVRNAPSVVWIRVSVISAFLTVSVDF